MTRTLTSIDPLYISEAEARGVDGVPGTEPRQAGDRLPASHVNFYIGEGSVVMLSFDDPRDRPAQEAVAALFPGRRVIAVPSREILLGGGTFTASPSRSRSDGACRWGRGLPDSRGPSDDSQLRQGDAGIHIDRHRLDRDPVRCPGRTGYVTRGDTSGASA
jgi:Porphyromonas-type peptidyl-arginine deiminase